MFLKTKFYLGCFFSEPSNLLLHSRDADGKLNADSQEQKNRSDTQQSRWRNLKFFSDWLHYLNGCTGSNSKQAQNKPPDCVPEAQTPTAGEHVNRACHYYACNCCDECLNCALAHASRLRRNEPVMRNMEYL